MTKTEEYEPTEEDKIVRENARARIRNHFKCIIEGLTESMEEREKEEAKNNG